MYEELQEIVEITFVLSGTYFIGYEINKVKKMKIHRPPNTILGAYNTCFEKKSLFIYKCNFEITGFAIRKNAWLDIEDSFEFMTQEFKRHIYKDYKEEVWQPLLEHKAKDFAVLENRADMNSIVAVNDQREQEMEEIKEELEDVAEDELEDSGNLERKLENLENLMYNIISFKEGSKVRKTLTLTQGKDKSSGFRSDYFD